MESGVRRNRIIALKDHYRQWREKMLKRIAAALLTGIIMMTGLSVAKPVYAANSVKRNTMFTTVAEMQSKLGTADKTTWSPV